MNLRELAKTIKPKGGKIVIKHRHPHRLESEYRDVLRSEVRKLVKAVRDDVYPAIKRELNGSRADSRADVLRSVNSLVNRSFGANAIARRIADGVKRYGSDQVGKAMADAVGVNVIPPDSGLSDTIDLWVEQNTSLIKDLTDTYLAKVRQTISDGFKNGWSSRDIASKLNEQAGISLRRAKNIARNEIGNLNAKLTEERDKELGIDTYVWRTMRDERVRGAPENGIGGRYPKAVPSHVAREGLTYKYSEPPAGGNPGEDHLCRCYAEAVIEF